jgi:uncharacterized protein YdiU (UPF0061 family)
MTLQIPFDNSYAALPEGFFTRINPKPVAAPRLIRFNEDLARDLGIEADASDPALADMLAGNRIPDGADPLAQAYAGHQFGGFSPQLGDGRANLLGEVIDSAGRRRDIQLKGSGPTPYSRMGDGRAWLGPVLREYVVSEAMHALGVPTTRALAAVETGEKVFRESGALPGAVLTRVADSHIRVGTFQFFLARRDLDRLQALFDYTRARHYPQAETPGEMLAGVIGRQARLIALWEGLGFIHGVMNTDNTTLSGETIDYGPCAYMDRYHPQTVFSSIDAQGRYSYANQAHVIVWNIAQLATCLVPLTPDQDVAVEEFTKLVHDMPALIAKYRSEVFARKIGLSAAQDGDDALVDDLLTLMQQDGADFTNTFRSLSDGAPRDQFTDRDAFDAWHARWQARIADETDPDTVMRAANPYVIPRNHRIEQMIAAARDGDYAPFDRLMTALATPYETRAEFADLTRPPLPEERVQQTFCGT